MWLKKVPGKPSPFLAPRGRIWQTDRLRNLRRRDGVSGVMVISRPDLSASEANARPTTVLMVEDEILIRVPVAEYLRKSGYTVIEAADAAEAIAVFVSGEPVDVVVSDVDLPGTMDGLSLARWIKQRHSAPPVLLTSGRGLAVTAVERLAFFFVAKPYRLEELGGRLKLMLASRDSAATDRPDPERR
jgi:DNA-binding NtrC family response regulator